MKSVLLTLLVTLSALPHAFAAAQTPVATPDPFMLPINHLVLRITEGNGYSYARDPAGLLEYRNTQVVDDGVVDADIPPTTRAWYEAHTIEDLYFASARMVPDKSGTGDSGITIQIALATLPDADAAAQLVPATLELMRLQEFQGATFPQDVATIENFPEHDQAIFGASGTDAYGNLDTGETSGLRAPFTRLIAQSGTTAASVKVTSLDPAFNDALARELLTEQLECLAADEPCLPLPLPSGMELTPATPNSSPVARRTSAARLNAHCRA